jgi:hypothetical protein
VSCGSALSRRKPKADALGQHCAQVFVFDAIRRFIDESFEQQGLSLRLW